LPKVSRSLRVLTAEMRYGRALLAGLGWAGVLGAAAVCVLLLLSAYLAFDGDRPGVGPRDDEVVRLPRVPDAEVPRVPLARPPSRLAPDRRAARRRRAAARARRRAPRVGTTPRAGTPGGTPSLPPGVLIPPAVDARPAPAAPGSGAPAPSGGGGGGGTAPPPRAPTIGDATTEVVQAVGDEVGAVSPPAGAVVNRTGETLGDAVDALTSSGPPR